MTDEENIICTPPEIRANAMGAINKLLPTKSKPLYEKEYNVFNSWCQQHCIQAVTENVLLAYFDEMSKTKKSSTLWASYSMLRACLNIYKDLDITKFMRLRGFLKRQSEGYQPKKSKILEASQIDRFLNEANDLSYLATKVGLIYELANAFVYIGKALFEALRARKLDSPAQHTAHLFYMSLAATSLPHTPMRRYLQHVH